MTFRILATHPDGRYGEEPRPYEWEHHAAARVRYLRSRGYWAWYQPAAEPIPDPIAVLLASNNVVQFLSPHNKGA